ncbi:MAG: GntR family transcriptional regulator, partial [Sphaerochaetaceae bacterium]
MKGIKAITKKNVTEEVFESLLQLIFKNTWVSGEKLPSEKSLCEQFDVSRITIRSALDRLNALGII